MLREDQVPMQVEPEEMLRLSADQDIKQILFWFLRSSELWTNNGSLCRADADRQENKLATLTARTCVVFLLLTSSYTVHAQGQNLFFVPPTYSGSGQTVTADFNGDGKPDLASQDGTVVFGNGDGTFRAGQNLNVPNGSIATADFNGDGKPDLLFASLTSNSVSVFLANGDGTFQPAKLTSITAPFVSIAVGDVNGDGKPDLLGVASFQGAGLLVCLGNGDGTFSSGVIFPAIPASALGQFAMRFLLASGDFNGDGRMDAVITFATNDRTAIVPVAFLAGNGDGSFKSAVNSNSVQSPLQIVATDFNGDGRLDLMVSDSPDAPSSIGGDIVILFGNGDGTFQAPVMTLPGYSGYLFGVTDVNKDGKADVLLEGFPLLQVFEGHGDGTFTLANTYSLLNQQRTEFSVESVQPSLVIADFNGDSNLDIAADGTILLGGGDGSFQGQPVVAGAALGPAVLDDFNNDGAPDLAIRTFGAQNLQIFLNDKHGVFSLKNAYSVPSTPQVATDANSDGNADLVLLLNDVQGGKWSVSVMLGHGDGSFDSPKNIASMSGGASSVASVDLNGDKKPDLVVLAGGVLYAIIAIGDGTYATPAPYFAASPSSSSGGNVVLADFNLDGKMDAAVATPMGISVLLGNGDGTFQPAIFPSTSPWQNLLTADLNGDGKPDLISGNITAQQIQVFWGNGDGTFAAQPTISGLYVVAIADMTADGKLDLIVTTLPTSPIQELEVFPGNGDGSFNSNPIVITPVSPVSYLGSILVADLNEDGLPDVAIPVVGNSTASVGLITMIHSAVPTQPPDFQIAASDLSPALIAPGGSTSSKITITPIGGFSGAVTLSCSGLPSGASCNFMPPTLSGSGTSTLTITTAPSSQARTLRPGNRLPAIMRFRLLQLTSDLLASVVILVLFLAWQKKLGRWLPAVGLTLLLCLAITLTSCGGSSGNNQNQGGNSGTPAGTYTVTITGSGASSTTILTHNTNIMLVVQ